MDSVNDVDDPGANSLFDFNRIVTDELYTELGDTVEGERVVGLALWESSLADEDGEEIPHSARDVFDLDIYLENQIAVELYATYVYSEPASDPLRGLQQIGRMLSGLIEKGVWLDEIAVTEEDELVLILSRHHEPQLYFDVGGWTLTEWETLPEEG